MSDTITQHIVQTPGTCGGRPRIAGHRIRVQDVVYWHEKRGKSADEIVSQFPGITLADVYAALAYYFDHRDEIESAFAEDARAVDLARARSSSPLREKLGEGP